MQAAVVWLEISRLSEGGAVFSSSGDVHVSSGSFVAMVVQPFGSMLVQAVPHEPWESFDPKDSLQQGAVAL